LDGVNNFRQRVLYLGDYIVFDKYTLEKTEETIKNGQSRETGNIGYTSHGTKACKPRTQHRKQKEATRILQFFSINY
jgi:hypothetical protein